MQLGGMPTGTLVNRRTQRLPDPVDVADDSGSRDSKPATKAPKSTSTGPSASDIRRQQEADAKREAARRSEDAKRSSQTAQRVAAASQAKKEKDKKAKAAAEQKKKKRQDDAKKLLSTGARATSRLTGFKQPYSGGFSSPNFKSSTYKRG